jgi:hypothetical protein
MLRQVALVTEVPDIPIRDLTRVAAAVQKQVTRDFGPIWDVEATVSVFNNLDDVPVGTWPVIIEKDIGEDPGVGGFHTTRDTGQPYALVLYEDGWEMTVSHETLEMLADPSGNRLQAADSVAPGQGRVNYLVEACDPCEAPDCGYQVNGITLSDFYTPHFFDPVQSPGVRYDFTGKIQKPLEVVRGGYLSWVDPISGQVFQERYFGNQPEVVNLSLDGRMQGEGSLRERVDRATAEYRRRQIKERASREKNLAPVKERSGLLVKSRQSQAQFWRARIAELKRKR